jgi:predicted Zn-dependent peptidase
MKPSFFALALTALLPFASVAAGIPDRPEKLMFPPLQYDPPKPAEYRVQLKSGPVAYVVEDRELPLVNIVVMVRTGQYLEPKGKEGLAGMTGYLLARGGTKSFTAEALEERLAFLAAQLQSGVGDTQGTVSLNLLSKDLDEGLRILREVLTEPRFQENKMTLRKQQLMQEMRMRNDDSASIEGREAGYLAFGEDFWGNRHPTGDSVQSLTREDVVNFHRQWFAPANFVVAVSGDFDRQQMISRLETLFGGWPFVGAAPPAIPTNTAFASPGVYILDKDVPQGRVSMMLPGVMRDDPDYFPIVVMNDILGGGGFTSRIMNRVRSDEGLAYDARSSFPGGVYFPLTFTAGFQTKSRTVAYAISIVQQEIDKIRAGRVSETELEDSKRGFIERFPRAFATKAQVATTFAFDEFTGRYAREPQFYEKYRDRIRSVSAEDVQRVANRYLDKSKLAILVVGKREEIMLGHPNHEAKMTQFAGGRVVGLPLRDPLTLRAPAK